MAGIFRAGRQKWRENLALAARASKVPLITSAQGPPCFLDVEQPCENGPVKQQRFGRNTA